MTDDDNGDRPDDYFVQRPPTPQPPPPDPYGQPAPWGQPPPGYGQHPVWGQPPGWTPPAPDRPVPLMVAEFFLGVASCVALNILGVILLARGDVLSSQIAPFLVIALNFVAIVVPAVMGHKSFSAGFAAGYGVIVVIGVVACFAFIESIAG